MDELYIGTITKWSAPAALLSDDRRIEIGHPVWPIRIDMYVIFVYPQKIVNRPWFIPKQTLMSMAERYGEYDSLSKPISNMAIFVFPKPINKWDGFMFNIKMFDLFYK